MEDEEMKTAKKLMSQMSGLDNPALLTVNRQAIREIQLDAMREGMRRAAETINPCSNPNCGNDECDLGRKILTAAEQLTTKDL